MPRLLVLFEFPTLLGGEQSMLAAVPLLKAAGFEIHAAAPRAGPLANALAELGVRHSAWEFRDLLGRRKPLGELRNDLAAVIASLHLDLVHANSLSTARVAGPVAAAAGTASLGHLRDIVTLSQQAVADLDCHNRLLAVSQATRDFHVAQGVEAAKCVVVHNGVDLQRFRPSSSTGFLHRELQLPPDSRLVTTIGQIGPRKGTDIALTAAAELVGRLPNLHWLIVGARTSDKGESHEFERGLRQKAAEPPLVGRVHFLGTRNDVPQLLVECELLVHAARQEPLGRVLLEAAACGRPIVATDVGGTREIFPDESAGAVLVPPNDSAALAIALSELLNDDAHRLQMARAVRRRAHAVFDIRTAAARLIENYHAVLSAGL